MIISKELPRQSFAKWQNIKRFQILKSQKYIQLFIIRSVIIIFRGIRKLIKFSTLRNMESDTSKDEVEFRGQIIEILQLGFLLNE